MKALSALFGKKSVKDDDGDNNNNNKKKKSSVAVECPICMEICPDVETLPHAGSKTLTRTNSGRNIESHKACGTCRAKMLKHNQKCPWCRDEVVWKVVLDFLDGIKKNIGIAHNPDTLADLMSQWQIYEVTRSNSDVILFARDMVEDVAMCAHLDRCIRSNPPFLRDSFGLWLRFYAMAKEGELKLSPEHFQRLEKAVQVGMKCFASNGGGAPQHGGAMYTQAVVALLCASQNGMGTNIIK